MRIAPMILNVYKVEGVLKIGANFFAVATNIDEY